MYPSPVENATESGKWPSVLPYAACQCHVYRTEKAVKSRVLEESRSGDARRGARQTSHWRDGARCKNNEGYHSAFFKRSALAACAALDMQTGIQPVRRPRGASQLHWSRTSWTIVSDLGRNSKIRARGYLENELSYTIHTSRSRQSRMREQEVSGKKTTHRTRLHPVGRSPGHLCVSSHERARGITS